jgi:Fe-S-cluster containining protein
VLGLTLPFSLKPVLSQAGLYLPFLRRLMNIYDEMDRRYEEAACHYGFVCKGCDDNCCRSRFYHHTLLEYLYLRTGFRVLPKETKQEIKKRAWEVCHQMARGIDGFVQMCPLNFDERCILYAHRPMICRLHGIPHELRKPGMEVQYHNGCECFHSQYKDGLYFSFDRTPLYLNLAKLERDLKTEMGITDKVRMTVAQMLIK